MPRTHTNVSVSITPELMKAAKQAAANKGFGNSFSAYVAKLIADDIAGSPELTETPPAFRATAAAETVAKSVKRARKPVKPQQP